MDCAKLAKDGLIHAVKAKVDRGDERQRKRQRLQRKGQIQRRSTRAGEGRERKGEEAKPRIIGESLDSEVVRAAGESAGLGMDSLAGSLDQYFCTTSEGPTGAVNGGDVFSTKGKTFADMAKPLSSMFSLLECAVDFPRSKFQFSGGIFPLPDCPRALVEVVGHVDTPVLEVLRGVCKALNSYNGTPYGDRQLVSAATIGKPWKLWQPL